MRDMCINIFHKRHIRRAIFAITAFVSTYIILWFIVIYQLFYPNPQVIISQLSAFSNKYYSQIEDSIFNTAFNASLSCRAVDTKQQDDCYKKVGIYMAQILHEEELDSSTKPVANELFFVKVKDNVIYSLGWSGKVKEVPLKGNEIIFNNSVLFVRTLTGNCGKLLNLQEESMKLCEVTIPVRTNLSREGHFVAWKVDAQEEYSIWQDILVFPPVALLMLLTGMLTDPLSFGRFIISFSPFLLLLVVIAYILPFITAYLMWRALKDPLTKEKKVH